VDWTVRLVYAFLACLPLRAVFHGSLEVLVVCPIVAPCVLHTCTSSACW